MTVGLYAGSFDPVHRGHLELIEAAASGLDRLFVVAAGNPSKGGSLLTLEQRRQLLAAATAHLPNVDSLAHEGLVVDLAVRLRVDALVRGMGREHQIELQMAATNTGLSGLPTMFFSPTPATAHLSSRMIRERLRREGTDGVTDLVPEATVAVLRAFGALAARQMHKEQNEVTKRGARGAPEGLAPGAPSSRRARPK